MASPQDSWSITIQGVGPLPDLETRTRKFVMELGESGVTIQNAAVMNTTVAVLVEPTPPPQSPPEP